MIRLTPDAVDGLLRLLERVLLLTVAACVGAVVTMALGEVATDVLTVLAAFALGAAAYHLMAGARRLP